MDQMDLFKIYLYSMGLYAKNTLKKQLHEKYDNERTINAIP